MQSGSRNCSPAPDLVFFKLMFPRVFFSGGVFFSQPPVPSFHIPQRGVQWKQGVVTYMILYTNVLYNTTPIHCTPLRLHPPVMNAKSLTIKIDVEICIYIYIYIHTHWPLSFYEADEVGAWRAPAADHEHHTPSPPTKSCPTKSS